MTMVAVCTDVTAPAEASAFSSCTGVAWTDSSNVAPGLFDGFTPDMALLCAGSVMVLWAVAWVVRQIAVMFNKRGF
jgi:hypothetical protein